MNACFSQCAAHTLDFIRSARCTLQIAVCWITHPDLYEALLQRCREGLAVTLILNYDQINFHPQGLNFSALARAGAGVYGYTGPGLLHHKFAIADRRQVCAGSFNWTRSENRDYLLWNDDAAVVEAFLSEFERLQAQCQQAPDIMSRPPQMVSFSQLYAPVACSIHDIRRRVIGGGRVWIWRLSAQERSALPGQMARQTYRVDCRGQLKSFWAQNPCWNPLVFRQWTANVGIRLPAKALRALLNIRVGDVLTAVDAKGRVEAIGVAGAPPEPYKEGDAALFVQWLVCEGDCAIHDQAGRKPGLGRYVGSGLALLARIEGRS